MAEFAAAFDSDRGGGRTKSDKPLSLHSQAVAAFIAHLTKVGEQISCPTISRRIIEKGLEVMVIGKSKRAKYTQAGARTIFDIPDDDRQDAVDWYAYSDAAYAFLSKTYPKSVEPAPSKGGKLSKFCLLKTADIPQPDEKAIRAAMEAAAKFTASAGASAK